MQKFAPSASRLPQDGQKFRGGAAARDTDDATTPSSGGDGEASGTGDGAAVILSIEVVN